MLLDFPGDTSKSTVKSLGDLVKGAGEDTRLALGMANKPDSAFNVDSVTLGNLITGCGRRESGSTYGPWPVL